MTQNEDRAPDIIGSREDELCAFLATLGQPTFRGRQLFEWIHKKGVWDLEAMTNLPRELREKMPPLEPPARIGTVLCSNDGTRKLEVLLNDETAVETVLIPDGDKLTQCISSQVGCAVRCVFCRSGHAGLRRNLTVGEIVAQVTLGRAYHKERENLRNIVFMGIGEPLHNTKNVLAALDILTHPRGLDLSKRRVTISTAGVVKGIDALAEAARGDIALAVSLHAADAETRARLVPGLKDTPEQIAAALARYPLPKRRRFTIEYVLIDGVNDSEKDARKLVKLLSNLRVKINLLPLNPHDKTDLEPPNEERVLEFQKILTDKGLTAILRRRRGADINAACGQLLCTKISKSLT